MGLPTIPSHAWSPWFSGVVAVLLAVAALAVSTHLPTPVWAAPLAVLFPLAVGAMTVPVPGVVAALVVTGAGFVARSPAVFMLGLVAFASYGAWFYYDVTWDLWTKGGAMIGVGALLILLGGLAGRLRG